ncbi:MAG: cupin domain-containing protein [Solirubrobacterales bacterium]
MRPSTPAGPSGSRGVVVSSPADVELSAEELDPGTVLEGDPRVCDGEIARSPSGSGDLVTGVWTCTPGRMTDVEADETFVVLEGRATIEAEGEEPVDVGPGDVCVLAAGTRTTWTVHEPLRKVYVIREE